MTVVSQLVWNINNNESALQEKSIVHLHVSYYYWHPSDSHTNGALSTVHLFESWTMPELITASNRSKEIWPGSVAIYEADVTALWLRHPESADPNTVVCRWRWWYAQQSQGHQLLHAHDKRMCSWGSLPNSSTAIFRCSLLWTYDLLLYVFIANLQKNNTKPNKSSSAQQPNTRKKGFACVNITRLKQYTMSSNW